MEVREIPGSLVVADLASAERRYIKRQREIMEMARAQLLASPPYIHSGMLNAPEQTAPLPYKEVKSHKRCVPPPIELPAAADVTAPDISGLAEYISVAEAIGLKVPALVAQQFQAFLAQHDIPVYNYQLVQGYMDNKSEREGNDHGWEWNPLRRKDRLDTAFGRPAETYSFTDRPDRPASGFWNSSQLYGQTVPLHALKKVALIEKEFPQHIVFAVCDYTPQPHFDCDPFLLAIVPGLAHSEGEGLFVIDFWNEPGFGLEAQLGVKMEK